MRRRGLQQRVNGGTGVSLVRLENCLDDFKVVLGEHVVQLLHVGSHPCARMGDRKKGRGRQAGRQAGRQDKEIG